MQLFEGLKIFLTEQIGQSLVYNAIQNRNIVRINYDGDESIAKGERIIEPYVLGRSNKNNIVVRAFQPYGDTSSSVPDWKLFKLENIISWKPTNKTFNSSPTDRGFNVSPYNPNGDKDMKFIRIQVNFNGSDEVTNTNKNLTNADNSRQNLVQQTKNKKIQQDKGLENNVQEPTTINKQTNRPNIQRSQNINNRQTQNVDVNQNNRLNNTQQQQRQGNKNINTQNVNNKPNTKDIQNNLKNDLDKINQNNLQKIENNNIENGKQYQNR